jgi:hypothetical protein
MANETSVVEGSSTDGEVRDRKLIKGVSRPIFIAVREKDRLCRRCRRPRWHQRDDIRGGMRD